MAKKIPESIVLDDMTDIHPACWATTVFYDGDDDSLVGFEHAAGFAPDMFFLTRKEARKLRNFLNKALEHNADPE